MHNCLDCHFLCLVSISRDGRNEQVIEPFPNEYRNFDDIKLFISKLKDNKANSMKCFRGKWDVESIGRNKTPKIENTVLREDRDKNCVFFSPFENNATINAVIEANKIKEDDNERKKTRRLAWIAIIMSCFATLLAAMLPFILKRFFP